ncbi:MAG: hypothetical protein JWN32_3627 [Solirubrobacterales bacterium]|nr:hypothetical protein [Solirubrobacterales bacterium]
MLSSALRLTALVCAALVVVSFALFARDEASGASKHQQQTIVAGASSVPGAPAQRKRHGQPRRFIDDAARTLETPFAHLVDSSDGWVTHGIPAVLGLALYGFGLGFLARYAHART